MVRFGWNRTQNQPWSLDPLLTLDIPTTFQIHKGKAQFTAVACKYLVVKWSQNKIFGQMYIADLMWKSDEDIINTMI